VFLDIKTKVERLDAELVLLRAQIDSREADLGSRALRIARDKAELDRLYDPQQPQAYNSRVPGFNASVESYNVDLATYRGLIEEYNAKVTVRNQSTIEQNNLVDSLSSKAADL
jgi:predicted  nucleic acid-binding Zn-ribbon protein